MRHTLLTCWFFCGLAANAFADAEAWTNQAGHVIHATLVEYTADSVLLRRSQGSTLRIPLAALCVRYRAGALEEFRANTD